MATWICMDCGMYDPYDGQGDGIGSCESDDAYWPDFGDDGRYPRCPA
jgi:hypothetical protein